MLRTPLSVCNARAQARTGEPLGDREAIEQLWRSFSDLDDLERHALDVGELSPEGVADSLERQLADGLLAV